MDYDFATKTIRLGYQGSAVEASLTCPGGIADAERFFEGLLSGNPKPSEDGSKLLQVVHGADGRKHQFANVGGTEDKLLLHMVNLRSVRDLEQKTGWDIDPLRFRANINYDGGAAWNEWDWVGKRVRCGSAILEIIEPTIRCPSTQVNPGSAVRDLDIPGKLKELYPDAQTIVDGNPMALGGVDAKGGYLGVYARVEHGGTIQPGDLLELLD